MDLSGRDFPGLSRTYRVTPIQQPTRSAAFNGAYLSRLPLAPPLIVQMDCWDGAGELTIPHDELPFLVCHLTLQNAEGQDATHVTSPSKEVVSLLYGSLVVTGTEMKDRAGANGIYFCFPDVSIRYTGRFRLKVNLMRITGGPPLHTCQTEPFDIVDNASYVAPTVTELTTHFHNQGIVQFGLPKVEW